MAKKKIKKSVQKDNRTSIMKEVSATKAVNTFYYREDMSVEDVAIELKLKSVDIIKRLMKMGIMANQTQIIDRETVELICLELEVEFKEEVITDIERFDEIVIDDDESLLEKRAPVVTIMGHVDHGKTTLLDTIRNSRVTDGEAGGITQHIGAYQVVKNNEPITFIDTPGHAAFTKMRARGASVTDITILVVAADDGVMPQTREAIEHAQAANCSIIVAINKMDKPEANPDKVIQELMEFNLVPEEWGGDTIFSKISAKNNEGIDELLDSILLLAEMSEYKANFNRLASGIVIESKLDKGRGVVATLLVQNGIIKKGDVIVCGDTFGKVRTLTNDLKKTVLEAGPSSPIEIIGLNDVPNAGDKFMIFENEKTARQISEKRKFKTFTSNNQSKPVTLDSLFSDDNSKDIKTINVIIKGDTQGSIEALKGSLGKIDVEGTSINVIRSAVGAITDTDVSLAVASKSIIIGFNVRPSAAVRTNAKNDDVEIRLYNIIYKVIEELESGLKGMLDPTFEEVVTGQAEIRNIFKISKVGTIAGCHVTDGYIARNSLVRILRDGIVVFEGKLASLKRFKDEAKEVKQGYECGMRIEGFNDLKENDIIETSIEQEIINK